MGRHLPIVALGDDRIALGLFESTDHNTCVLLDDGRMKCDAPHSSFEFMKEIPGSKYMLIFCRLGQE